MKKMFSLALVLAVVLSAMAVPAVSADAAQDVNLALNKEAWAFSYYNDGTTVLSPDKAVDGVWNKGDCFINGSGSPMYWAVDLGAMCDISSIRFDAVRAGGGAEEFINFRIELSKTLTFTADSTVTVATYGAEGATEITTVPVATDETYRYVRFIKTDGASHLCLVEVEVMGTVVTENKALSKPTWQNAAPLANNDALYGTVNMVDGAWRPSGYGTNTLEGTLINCGAVADYYCAVDLQAKCKIDEIVMELGRSNGCDAERCMMNIEVANKEDFSDAVTVKSYGAEQFSATDAQIISVAAEGTYRYVRVYKTDGKSCMSIAELEVYGVAVEENYAYKKSPWVSSYVYAPENAVDGSWNKTTQNTFIACGADTAEGSPAYWAVDLGDRYEVNSIRFTGRYSGCAEEYVNFKIQLSNDRDFAASETVNVANYTTAFTMDDVLTVTVDQPRAYRYVRFVKTNTTNHLCMAEVEVWGSEASTALTCFTDETLATEMDAIPESGSFAYCLNAVNDDTANAKTFTVIVASYAGGSLDTVSMYNHSVGAGETEDFVQSVAAAKGNEYKVFLWDMNGILPFIEAIPLQ